MPACPRTVHPVMWAVNCRKEFVVATIFDAGKTTLGSGRYENVYAFSSDTSLPKSEALSCRVDTRFSERQYESLLKHCETLGIAPSRFMRAVTMDAIDGNAERFEQIASLAGAIQRLEASDDFRDAMAQFRRVGINLNQCLKRGLLDEKTVDDLRKQLNNLAVIVGSWAG